MLRDYQSTLIGKILNSCKKATVAVMPTGAGKTVCMTHVARAWSSPGVDIVHRQELVEQISLAHARAGLAHQVIAPDSVVRACVETHKEILGEIWVRRDPACPVAVAGVDTLIKRPDHPALARAQWAQLDECHHCTPSNKWGRALTMLPNVTRIVGWTANPMRGDGQGLDGCFDELVVGPTMRDLITCGYLADYKIYGAKTRLNLRNVHTTRTGDFNAAELAAATAEAQMTGDVVEHYLRYGAGQQWVTFAVSVAHATELAEAYRAAGVSAAVLHAKTGATERRQLIREYRGGRLTQVCNVDVLGEGFDLPAIRGVSMARAIGPNCTGLFDQQFGRALRPLEGKPRGVIIDHAGNCLRHGLPDLGRAWSLSGRSKGAVDDVRIRRCESCFRDFEGFEPACPYCGWTPERQPAGERERPDWAAGDLELYSPEVLAQLRGEVARIGAPGPDVRLENGRAQAGLDKSWTARRDAQTELAAAIDAWAYRRMAEGDSIRAAYRRFYAEFGMDTLAALAQTGPAMWKLAQEVKKR